MTLQFKYKIDDKIKKLLKNVVITSSYSETLGFFNGNWEFNFGLITSNMEDFTHHTLNIIDNYILLGGHNIDLSKFNASDDTILTMAVIDGIINKNYRKGIQNYRQLLLQEKRASGINTTNIINYVYKNPNIKLTYNDTGGGNGAAIRTSPIGIIFDNIKDIITHSFFNSIETHNNTIGFMGGIATAIITFFAKKNIKPTKWFDEFIKIDEDGVIENILKKYEYQFQDKYTKDKFKFWDKIKDYNEFRKPKILKRKFENVRDRYDYHLRTLRSPNYKNANKNFVHLGASGIEVIILSFEAILLSYDEKIDTIDFNKLVYYGILHFGDNDSTGSVLGAWYSAYHNKIPSNIKQEQLEFIKDINNIIDKLN